MNYVVEPLEHTFYQRRGGRETVDSDRLKPYYDLAVESGPQVARMAVFRRVNACYEEDGRYSRKHSALVTGKEDDVWTVQALRWFRHYRVTCCVFVCL